ncbi:hypothetical protein J6590_043991 [Homalodisca vitripennis]|nr:hypothetical protein J6590_043991 [Homalodisca vitripennis]
MRQAMITALVVEVGDGVCVPARQDYFDVFSWLWAVTFSWMNHMNREVTLSWQRRIVNEKEILVVVFAIKNVIATVAVNVSSKEGCHFKSEPWTVPVPTSHKNDTNPRIALSADPRRIFGTVLEPESLSSLSGLVGNSMVCLCPLIESAKYKLGLSYISSLSFKNSLKHPSRLYAGRYSPKSKFAVSQFSEHCGTQS